MKGMARVICFDILSISENPPILAQQAADDAEYARIAAQMEHTEENAAVITSLLARAAP